MLKYITEFLCGGCMDYNQIIGELNRIINSEFNMQNFRELKKQNSNKKLCAIVFDKYISFTNEVIWKKLKETFDFEDEVINRIFSFIRVMDEIDDMYVLDGNVIVRRSNKTSDGGIYVAPELDFIDITDKCFVGNNVKNKMTNLVVMSINNIIKPLIENRVKPSDILSINDDKIDYKKDNLNIYLSHNMSDILTDSSGNKVTKVSASYDNNLLYYDMKIRDDYVILLQNNYEVKVISKMLDKSEKKNKR